MVGAYTLTMVTYWFLEKASQSDMIRSLIPLGKLVTFDKSSVCMANPTPASRCSCSAFPHQKKEYSELDSVICPCPASLVSLSAAMSML